jgi:hypothetical protein
MPVCSDVRAALPHLIVLTASVLSMGLLDEIAMAP